MKPIVINEVAELPIEYLSPHASYAGHPPSQQVGNGDMLLEARRAAEAHRRSRYRIQRQIKPGMSLDTIVDIIEEGTRTMLKEQMNNGIGFPTGVSINECAAHHTPNPGDAEVLLLADDVLKIDFGTHVNGRIIDSAFTICFDPKYEKLLEAAKEATETGIKFLSVDARVCDIGAEIEEVMNSFELVIGNKVFPIRPVENLNGHSIGQYQIHAGIMIPIVKNHDTTRITADTFYALETFSTTGQGYVQNRKGTSHFMLDTTVRKPPHSPKNKKVLDFITKNLSTLPFCPRYIDLLMKNEVTCKPSIDILASMKFLEPHPPLVDTKGSHVAQFEHTIFLTEFGREVLTRGDDY